MNQDPFANYLDDDQTVIKPSPGRRKKKPIDTVAQSVQSENTAISLANGDDFFLNLQQLNLHSANELVSCSLPLLSLVAQLRNTMTHPDVTGLRVALVNEVKRFDKRVRETECSVEQAQVARYILCALLDEVVLNTPWGCDSIWSTQGLLISFHNETWGGEKFFNVLDKIISQPGSYIDLLELFYYCLSLGFEGKYKIQASGQNKLSEIREKLYHVIERYKDEDEQVLSSQWIGITDRRNVLARYLPLWVVVAILAALLMFVFLGFLFAINQHSTREIEQQYSIRDTLVVLPEAPKLLHTVQPPVISKIDEVRQFLVLEIEEKKVVVLDDNGQAIIRILANYFFASGSNKIKTKFLPLLEKISQALANVNNPVTVVGHTDNRPIFTVRYPSNWVLSESRAQAVANILSKNKQQESQIMVEGRADTQPLVANDTPAQRAMNRRIEIHF